MWYVGSKGRFKKELIPIIQKYIDDNNIKSYIEPFVGGANVIDKIKCHNKIGYDNNKYLIALLNKLQEKGIILPDAITFEEYKKIKESYKNNTEAYPDWYKGLVGFCSAFASIFFSTYAREHSKDNRGYCTSRAINNLKKQIPYLQDTIFLESDYKNIDTSNITNSVIYCDPPYKGTMTYKKGDIFAYTYFYKWCKSLSKNNIVLISEYNMPETFAEIWSKKTVVGVPKNRNVEKNKRQEKLFICE